MKNTIKIFASIFLISLLGQVAAQIPFPYREIGPDDIQCGAERTERYFNLLEGRNIGVVANHTSLINSTHLVDSLLSAGFKLTRVFGPEHGFRGSAAAGEHVNGDVDQKSGVEIVSLYGSKKKPTSEDLQGIDVMLFDMQDVGLRFYTYVSTMTYIMEACAENDILLIILDRPNPNGHYVDGPVLDPKFSSFVGLHPVPVVHGMTLGEYARMLNGEKWLNNGIQCNLRVVPVARYVHTFLYQLPVNPSPNLPNMAAVYLYPSLAFFEGTVVSVGRGTDHPFQVFGHPDLKGAPYSFTPESRPEAPKPKLEGKVCKGYDLTEFGDKFIRNYRQLYLYWLIETYRDLGGEDEYFNSYFDKLAGTDLLRKQINSGLTETQIRETWQIDLTAFMSIRKKYLLYPDFQNDGE